MTYGRMGTDREERIDYNRMREYRLARAKQKMEEYGIGCLLTFDAYNMRYLTGAYSTVPVRLQELQFVVLPRNGDPYLYGTSRVDAEQTKKLMPWLKGKCYPFQMPHVGRHIDDPDDLQYMTKLVGDIMAEHGVANEPVGLDGTVAELVWAEAFKRAGIKCVHAIRPMWEARKIKNQDEIECVRQAAANAEAAFADMQEAIKPGITEGEIVGVGMNRLYALGADEAQEFVCATGPRTNPLNVDFTDRQVRPGDLVIIDINSNSYNGYRTCYYRTLCCGKPNAEQEEIYEICRAFLYETMNAIKAGRTTEDIYEKIPFGSEKFNGYSPKTYGWDTWGESTVTPYGHGIGISLHDYPWLGPMLSKTPMKLEEGMVVAVENWFGYKGGYHGVRLEENIAVTKDGYDLLTKFPIDKLSECWIH